jgi:hypothetical protein
MVSIQIHNRLKQLFAFLLSRNILRRLKMFFSFSLSKGRLPDFLIIGAQKAGTTSLFHYVGQHPDIQLPLSKEIHYYDLNYTKGTKWYRSFFASVIRTKITGESTPYYLFHPFVPARVYHDNPKTKIIILLRHPGERAFSHFQMMKRMGIEKLETFSEAIQAEHGRLKKGLKYLYTDSLSASFEHQHYTYLSRGKYARQLKRWFHYFSKEQILIIKSEDLFENPIKTLEKVYLFLGVDVIYPKDISTMNPGLKENIHPDDKKCLEEYFHKYNRKLELLLDSKFNWEAI